MKKTRETKYLENANEENERARRAEEEILRSLTVRSLRAEIIFPFSLSPIACTLQGMLMQVHITVQVN